jgi:hypothetical protein
MLGAYFEGCSRDKSTPRTWAPGYFLYIDISHCSQQWTSILPSWGVRCLLSHVNHPDARAGPQIQDSGSWFGCLSKRGRMELAMPGNREEFVEQSTRSFSAYYPRISPELWKQAERRMKQNFPTSSQGSRYFPSRKP